MSKLNLQMKPSPIGWHFVSTNQRKPHTQVWFGNTFKDIPKLPPFDYLISWQMSLSIMKGAQCEKYTVYFVPSRRKSNSAKWFAIDINENFCRKVNVTFKSSIEDTSKYYKQMNITILDFLHGAATPAATLLGDSS